MRVYESTPRVEKPVVASKMQLRVKPELKHDADDDFGFTYSDHYNLTRLPPEEAAARRKKLEEEGH